MDTAPTAPRPIRADDVNAVVEIINSAAQRYRGAIPDDCWREPYMPQSELEAEIEAGVKFWGSDDLGGLLGVMGMQSVGGVQLIRHAYVQPRAQGHGVGRQLLRHLMDQSTAPLLVGTWAAAEWAIAFYQRNGFELVEPEETRRLLSIYWHVPERQAEVSVVLRRRG